jgi:hypothetical protein
VGDVWKQKHKIRYFSNRKNSISHKIEVMVLPSDGEEKKETLENMLEEEKIFF